MKQHQFYDRFVKRVLDIVLAVLGILVTGIPMGILCIIIYKEDPGNVIFKQKRVGRDKAFFQLYKFRTMRRDTPSEVPTHLLENPDQYILKSGKTLRRLSLDEIPQLFNILKGEMSFVGPRPALWNQEDLIEKREEYKANSVRPGLTGWAQINGRDELEIEVKARLDGEYVQKESFLFDCKCFFGTFSKAVTGENVREGSAGEKQS